MRKFFGLSILLWMNIPAQQLSLSALLDLKNQTKIASGTLSMSPQESPGIVSIIDQDQIKRLGARDLIDVLRTIPGFEFSGTVQGEISMGIRGQWGVLFLVDGVQMNEDFYSALQYGGNYPISAIRRIEIIRGPGSALYGGEAEAAVINIVTKDDQSNDGLIVQGDQGLSVGRSKATNSMQKLTAAFSKSWGDWSVEANAVAGRVLRSDGSYTDVYGASTPMDQAWIKPVELNASLRYKDWELYGMWDQYNMDRMDSYTQALAAPLQDNFGTYALGLKGKVELTEDLQFLPVLEYRLYIPWSVKKNQDSLAVGPWGPAPFGDPTPEPPAGIYSQDGSLDLHFGWRAMDELYFDLGHKLTYSRASEFDDTASFGTQQPFYGNHLTMERWDFATYAQGIWQLPWFNVTLGGRDDYNSLTQVNSFVPRFAITKAWDKAYVKVLASEAFRAPNFAEIYSNFNAIQLGVDSNLNYLKNEGKIKPEETVVYEIQAGGNPIEHWSVAANVYWMTINNPIVFSSDSIALNNYFNANSWATTGAEFETRGTWEHLHLGGTYSFCWAMIDDTILKSYMGVPGHSGMIQGTPSSKITADISYEQGDWLVGTNGIWNTAKYSQGQALIDSSGVDAQGNKVYAFSSVPFVRIPANLTWNAHLMWEPKMWSGFYTDLGVNNILNQNYVYAATYSSYHMAIPSLSRTIYLSLGWRMGMN